MFVSIQEYGKIKNKSIDEVIKYASESLNLSLAKDKESKKQLSIHFGKQLFLHFTSDVNKSRFERFVKNTKYATSESIPMHELFLNIALDVFVSLAMSENNHLIGKTVILNKVINSSIAFSKMILAIKNLASNDNEEINQFYVDDQGDQIFIYMRSKEDDTGAFHPIWISQSKYNQPFHGIKLKDIIRMLLKWFKESDSVYSRESGIKRVLDEVLKKEETIAHKIGKQYIRIMNGSKTKEELIKTVALIIEKCDSTIEDKLSPFSSQDLKEYIDVTASMLYISQSNMTTSADIYNASHKISIYYKRKSGSPSDFIEEYIEILREASMDKPNDRQLLQSLDFIIHYEKNTIFLRSLKSFMLAIGIYDPLEDILNYKVSKRYRMPLKYSHTIKSISRSSLPLSLKKSAQRAVFILSISSDHDISTRDVLVFISSLYKNGVKIKNINAFVNRFLNIKLYVSEIGSIPVVNDQMLHDIAYSTMSILEHLETALSTNTHETAKLSRLVDKLLIMFSSYNVESIDKAKNICEHVMSSPGYYRLLYDKTFTSEAQINAILLEEKRNRIENDIAQLKKHGIFVSNTLVHYSSMKKQTENVLAFLNTIATNDSLRGNFISNDNSFIAEEKIDDIKVGIYPYNNDIGLLGSIADGVCIQAFGHERLTHMNQECLNLCVHSERYGIALWGLLVSAKDDDGDTWWILNNLQGSIHGHLRSRTAEIRNLIVSVLKKINSIGVIAKDQYFNAMNLINRADMPYFNGEYNIETKIKQLRLDVSINKNGKLEAKKHEMYIIQKPENIKEKSIEQPIIQSKQNVIDYDEVAFAENVGIPF